jgi:hypothetical protein
MWNLKITGNIKNAIALLPRKEVKKSFKACSYEGDEIFGRNSNESLSEKQKNQLVMIKGYMYSSYMYALELLYIFYK